MFNEYDERYIKHLCELWRGTRKAYENAKDEGNDEMVKILNGAVSYQMGIIAGVVKYIGERDGMDLHCNFYYGILTIKDGNTGERVDY